ncbi:MAG: cell wall-binding repeat-containing protein, partial [Acidimicrobiales bacterium]
VIDGKLFTNPTTVLVGNGQPAHIVDALTAGPWAGKLGAPIVVTDNGKANAAVTAYLHGLPASTKVVILGGTASLPDSAATTLASDLG